MQPHKHIRQLIDRFLEGTCTRAELKELFSLLQEEEHDDAVLHELDALWRKITGHDGGDTVDIEDRTDLLDAAHTDRSEEHTSELQSRGHPVCRLSLEIKKRSTRLTTLPT